MKSGSNPIMRLLPSTIFGRLAASLLLVVGVTLIVIVALVLRDRTELSIRVGSVSDSAHRIEALTRDYEALQPDARAAFIETNPTPIKEAMAMAGMIEPEFRLPMCRMSDANRARLRGILEPYGLVK